MDHRSMNWIKQTGGNIMNSKSFLVGIITVVSTSGVIALNPTSANARTYTTVPTSLRGHWYHLNSNNRTYTKVFASKYVFNANGLKLYGNKFPWYGYGHSQLFVYKNSKGYYNIGQYASDEWPYWKRVRHNGTYALKEYMPLPPYDYQVKYFYHYSHFTAMKYRTVKSNGFYFNKYIPGFLQAGSTANVYTTPEDAAAKTGKSYHITNIFKKMSIKWNDGNHDDILKINYDGNTFYYNDTDGAFQPYNTFRDGTGITSPYNPKSKSKIYLKHGNHIYNGTRWDKSTTYKDGTLISNSYKLKNDHWVKVY